MIFTDLSIERKVKFSGKENNAGTTGPVSGKSMRIDRDLIIRVAELARLELSEEEMGEFSKQLSEIVQYVEKINELNTDSVEPTDHIVELKNVFRSDTVGESLPVEAIKVIAPSFEEGHVVVPKVIE